jgi:hypothetical protein
MARRINSIPASIVGCEKKNVHTTFNQRLDNLQVTLLFACRVQWRVSESMLGLFVGSSSQEQRFYNLRMALAAGTMQWRVSSVHLSVSSQFFDHLRMIFSQLYLCGYTQRQRSMQLSKQVLTVL